MIEHRKIRLGLITGESAGKRREILYLSRDLFLEIVENFSDPKSQLSKLQSACFERLIF